jgi:hypothetical protein
MPAPQQKEPGLRIYAGHCPSKDRDMSIATDSNPATPATAAARPVTAGPGGQAPAAAGPEPAPAPPAVSVIAAGQTAPDGAVERALAAAIRDAGRIGDLLDVLRTARLWLPLPDDGTPVVTGTAVALPTVSYLGCDFVPAYSSARLLHGLVRPAGAEPDSVVPHVVVRAADLARLLPPSIGIALNPGASESVPVYPQGVTYLAADNAGSDQNRISVGPLPVRPDQLLAGLSAGFARLPGVREAAAAWLSVQFAGEGLLISVHLDDPADASSRDSAIAAIEHAVWQAPPVETGFPVDVTFPGEGEPDHIDEWVAAFTTPFYRR